MEITLIDDEYLGIKFSFNQTLIDQIRALENRRWNPGEKRWEVHIVHLPELLKICFLHPAQIDEHIFNIYRKQWIQTNLRVKVNHIYITLSGTSIPFEKIDEVTSFWISGSEYNPKYIEGVWDGRRHLFNKRTYQLPTGLLNKVLNILEQYQINYLLIDERTTTLPTLNLAIRETNQVRKYQKSTIQKAVQEKRGIIEMATGAGKTMVAAGIIARLQRPTLFFVHTRELLYQTREYFELQFGIPIGQLGDGVVDLQPITVATIQTTIRALGGEYHRFDEEDEDDPTDISRQKDAILTMIENYPIVFFDECHHLPSDTCYTVAMHTKQAEYRYGLSATPYRSDHQDLLIEAALDEKIVQINASMLIDERYLVPPQITFLPVPSHGIKKTIHDYATIYQTAIIENQQRNIMIANKARELVNQELTVLILVQQVKHGKLLSHFLPEAEFVQGADSSAKRNRVWKNFREQHIKIVIATTLADEGLDIPTLGALILAGGGKSETRALQRVGRVLRKSENKDKAIIIDFMDEAPYLKDHSKNRWDIYLTEPRFSIRLEKSESSLVTKPYQDKKPVLSKVKKR
jgi:superfamily II DNA or RNA helicase